jgi:hypothetical protein
MRDLMVHQPEFTLNDVHLLKIGRHFRLSPDLKLVVGRNEDDNKKLQVFAQENDVLLKVHRYAGPLSLLRGEISQPGVERAAAITVRYGKAKDLPKVEVYHRRAGDESEQAVSVSAMAEEEIKGLMIGD